MKEQIDTLKNIDIPQHEALAMTGLVIGSAAGIALAVYQTKLWVALQSVGIAAAIGGYGYMKYKQAEKRK